MRNAIGNLPIGMVVRGRVPQSSCQESHAPRDRR
jgi:hypothetical protein